MLFGSVQRKSLTLAASQPAWMPTRQTSARRVAWSFTKPSLSARGRRGGGTRGIGGHTGMPYIIITPQLSGPAKVAKTPGREILIVKEFFREMA